MSIPFSLPKALKSLVIVLISAIVVIFVINSSIFDEELLPELSAILKPKTPLAEEQNIYYALIGLPAADGKDMIDAGVQLTKRYRDNLENRQLDDITSQDHAEIMGSAMPDKLWKKQYPRCNTRIDASCFENKKQLVSQNPITDPRLLLLLDRYNAILKMQHYEEIPSASFNQPSPSYDIMLKLSELKLFNSYLQQPITQHLDTLRQELKFWRQILSQSESILGQMVAVAGIRSALSHLSGIIRENTLSPAEIVTIKELLTPISPQENNIANAFLGEGRYIYELLQNPILENSVDYGTPAFLMRSLTQTNATLNNYYNEVTLPLIELSKLATDDFADEVIKRAKRQTESKGVNVSLSSLYNLGGKLIARNFIAGTAYDYIGRIHDLNGIFELVSLQLDLKGLEGEQVTQAVESSRFRNPYTGQPFKVDLKRKQLSFKCIDKSPQCTIFF